MDAEELHQLTAAYVLDALEGALAGRRPPGPWAVAFGAPADLPPVRHVLLGMNAHINYDLPQALVAVITDEQFDDAISNSIHFVLEMERQLALQLVT